MRFLGDMSMSARVVRWWRDQEHDATHLREQNLKRFPDGVIFHKAYEESRIILARDLGFVEILPLSGTQTVRPLSSATGTSGQAI